MRAMAGIGLLTTLAIALIVAGASKLRNPDPPRRALRALGVSAGSGVAQALGAGELGIAALALAAPAALSGAVLAALFAGFALAAHRLARAGAQAGCGCFGEADGRPPGRAQVAVNVAVALAAAAVAAQAPQSPAQLAGSDPRAALATLATACLLVVLWRRALHGRARPSLASWGGDTVVDVAARVDARAPRARDGGGDETSVRAGSDAALSERLVGASATFLEQRFSRRSALVRIAVAGSALCVAPLRYLLYPQPALAVIVPGDCAEGDCTDGYTAFCCEINRGLNKCPPGTFPGGWWMCTDYQGRQLCSGQGVRYYVDCNALPDRPYPGGCVCANGTCFQRRVNCNIFRYGQCNTQIPGVTAVVCRMVVCQNPGSIPHLNCSSSVAVDDAVCGHEAPCLEPPAMQLAGAGGV
jgi:hypothetical protein